MNARSAAGVLLALALTTLLGLLLRWQLAGAVALFAGNFANLRHVHTHLGFYGALLPLAWLAAAGDDDALPRFVGPAYALCVVGAHLGFALSGYGILAIAGSTGVLATWLFAAWKRRRLVIEGDGWLAGMPIAIPIAALCIPFITITLRQDPALSASLVRVFLSVLVLGVLAPAALHVLGARAPPRPTWLLAALLGAAALGFEQVSLLLLPAALILLVTALRARLELLLRAMWVTFGVGAGAVAVGALRGFASSGVASLHFAILGPVLLGLAWPYLERLPLLLRLAWALAVAAMSGAILLRSPLLSAITSSVVVTLLLVGIGWLVGPSLRVKALDRRLPPTAPPRESSP